MDWFYHGIITARCCVFAGSCFFPIQQKPITIKLDINTHHIYILHTYCIFIHTHTQRCIFNPIRWNIMAGYLWDFHKVSLTRLVFFLLQLLRLLFLSTSKKILTWMDSTHFSTFVVPEVISQKAPIEPLQHQMRCFYCCCHEEGAAMEQ